MSTIRTRYDCLEMNDETYIHVDLRATFSLPAVLSTIKFNRTSAAFPKATRFFRAVLARFGFLPLRKKSIPVDRSKQHFLRISRDLGFGLVGISPHSLVLDYASDQSDSN